MSDLRNVISFVSGPVIFDGSEESVRMWQHISTAPKDGELVDLWCGSYRLTDCWWQSFNEHFPSRPLGWICSKAAGNPFALAGAKIEPTHWMPLPEPPSAD